MNHHHMMALANENTAIRRAEADRARLARTARSSGNETGRSTTGTRQARRHGLSLGSLLHRVATL
jgi:hypothetical protein